MDNSIYSEAFERARNFLIREIDRSDAQAILDSYLSMPDKSNEPIIIGSVFLRLLESAQNANMKAGVIGGSIGGVKNLGKVLFDFDPIKVDTEYAGDSEKLLQDIVSLLAPRGKVRREQRSIWPKYCITILSTAAFLARFKDGADFKAWVNSMYTDPRSMAALPLVLQLEIEGIGYTLACDFLKELGYINYGKPDVHLIDIFTGIGLCDEDPSPYQVQKTIQKIAESVGTSAYAVDKLFWLIGSGKFYHHPELDLGRMKV
jgi:hypothetical protein